MYCSANNRVPSWCDRILWHVHKDAYSDVKLNVELDRYTSVDDYVDSDHKPVIAHCCLQASTLLDFLWNCPQSTNRTCVDCDYWRDKTRDQVNRVVHIQDFNKLLPWPAFNCLGGLIDYRGRALVGVPNNLCRLLACMLRHWLLELLRGFNSFFYKLWPLPALKLCHLVTG